MLGVTAVLTIALGAVLALAGCASTGDGGPPEHIFGQQAEYRVSCSVSDECRVQFIDQEGVLRARDIVGEWKLTVGVDPGTRLWVALSAGGCPPRPLRVEIWLGGTTVAHKLERATHGSRCDWLRAETEFTVP